MTSLPSEPTDSVPVPESNAASPSLLNSAWERYRVYSQNASKAQERFLAVERLITLLALLVVVLAVVHPIVLRQTPTSENSAELNKQLPLSLLFDQQHVGLGMLNLLLIILPISITALRAFAIKFSRGNSWVILRGNAEALKMEIFYYRTQVKRYQTDRNTELAEKIQQISQRLKGSVVHQRALFPYENQRSARLRLGVVFLAISRLWSLGQRLANYGWEFFFAVKEEAESLPKEPDRTSDLDPEGYIKYRLEEQFDWYRRKARSYDRQHQLLQTSVYIFGGFGTLLAAIGFQSWVAVTATIAASLVNYLEYRRVEVTLMGYNQSADALYDIRTWWYSLSADKQASFNNFEKLVVNTEETIRSEHNSWLQDMQDRLSDLYESEGKKQHSAPHAKVVDAKSAEGLLKEKTDHEALPESKPELLPPYPELPLDADTLPSAH
ncbi:MULTISPECIES: DUF4231 domain-containing protein [Cyanophyceae]|uniref:DUF4231 domain-containing protein n=1 Tax=Leptolyngbya subtilissima DQ-A4 TaxID=2933933 RepID=A0ABV0K8E5_9CYAN|nr:DUF4231 domain-containing protein [Nodosilinea sp. FACHB-141]MBD2114530.1 DUF4231 domain-containing protein [Nodosilinea sp. FACHB-141]